MIKVGLGDIAPNFDAETTEGNINFHKWLGNYWGILFSHPADYTPVCTTELGVLAKYKEAFNKKNVKIIALSIDGIEEHYGWIEDINETQKTTVNFPLIADEDKHISMLYGMIHPNADDTLTARSVYIIGPDKKIKLTMDYPASTGRNFDELLRVVDSLQLAEYHKIATPANWEKGQDCLIAPTVSSEQIPKLFPKGHKEIKPYLRFTPQPDL